MASGLTDLGRGGNRQQVLVTSALHTVGGGLGGACVGALVGLAALALPDSATAFVLAVALLLAAAAYAHRPLHRQGLGLHRQVNRRLSRDVGVRRAYFVWGVELGTGVLTYVPYSGFLALVAVAILLPPAVAVGMFLIAGLTRAAVSTVVGRRAPNRHSVMDLLHTAAGKAALTNRAVLVLAAIAIASGLAWS